MSWLEVLLLMCAVSWSFAQETLINFAENPTAIPFDCLPSMKMIDASGKFPAGISSGHIVELGAFDQCIKIKEKVKNSTDIIKGKYCIMKIAISLKNDTSNLIIANLLKKHPLGKRFFKRTDKRNINNSTFLDMTMGLLIGWCLPHTCDTNKIEELFEIIGMEVKPSLEGLLCQTEDDVVKEFTDFEWAVISFFIVVFMIMVISTTYDIYLHFVKKSPAHVLLLAFSVKSNSEKLLTVSHNPNKLPCINGIRFISMMWVVLGHRYYLGSMGPNFNNLDLEAWAMKDSTHMHILNALLSVDTFLVLSGMLTGYVFCFAKTRGISFNIPLYYIHRYLRLTPVLAVVVLIHATIIPHFGSGPFWPYATSNLQKPCIKYWWTALTYIQNYYNPGELCIIQTWYLSVDFQICILSPLILIPLWKKPKTTLIATALLIVGSMISDFVLSYYYELSAFPFASDNLPIYIKKYYIATHARFGPWLMGLMLGYYLFILKKNKNKYFRYKLNVHQVLFGWILALTIMLTCMYSAHNLLLKQDNLANAFWNGFHRHAWALGLCWVIFACTQGHGGVINSFLSWSAFQILGRFTYTIYLIHYSTIQLLVAANRTNTYFSDFNAMYLFWGDMFLNLGLSVILTLAFESPMITVENLLFPFAKEEKENPDVLSVHQPN